MKQGVIKVFKNGQWVEVPCVLGISHTPIVDHGVADTTFALTPNKYHMWGEVASLNLTLANPTDSTIANEYIFQFTSGTQPTTLSLPESIKWIGSNTIEASKTYQVSIVNNIAIMGGV